MLQGDLILQLDALVWMNSKSRLIKNIIKLEILSSEIKRMVFIGMDKFQKKNEKNETCSKYFEAGFTIFKIKIKKVKKFQNQYDFL